MEKTIIQLKGHDLTSKNMLSLVDFDENYVRYKLVTPYSNILKCGLDSENSNKINWIDPSGGPLMKLGYKVNDLELTSISHSKKYKAFILEFKRV